LEAQEKMNRQSKTDQKDQCWKNHNTRLETILQSLSNKNSMLLAQKQNKIENLDINPHSYTSLIIDKGGKNILWRKDSLFNKHC
jgi:hypothetical protein